MSGPEKKKNGYGGPRPGSGPKPKLITILKRRKLENSAAEAEKSFDLLVQFRDDPIRPDELRKDCAIEIMDRVWGKSKNVSELTGKNGAPLSAPINLDLSKFTNEQLQKFIELAAVK